MSDMIPHAWSCTRRRRGGWEREAPKTSALVSDMKKVPHEVEGYNDEVDGSSVKDDVAVFRHDV